MHIPLSRHGSLRYEDQLPPLPHLAVENTAQALVFEDSDSERLSSPSFRTNPDSYGVYREYSCGRPSITPDSHLTLSDISDSPYLALNASTQLKSTISSVSSPASKNVNTVVDRITDCIRKIQKVLSRT